MEEPANGPTGKTQERRTLLACERCKRRKIKCDRTLPVCRSCQKNKHNCHYPTSSQKPGPKPGASQRRRISRHSAHEREDSYPSSASLGVPSFPPTTTPSQSTSTTLNGSSLSRQTPQSPCESNTPLRKDHSASGAAVLSHILHLSHDPVPSDGAQAVRPNSISSHWRGIDAVCTDLEISSDVYTQLLNAYFDNVTAFSLFHRPTFAAKIASITLPIQQRALIASMFALSSRFLICNSLAGTKALTHDHFRLIATQSVDQALTDCLDETPPLCLLQALILTTFQQLTNGVRGRSRRALHTCISIAYDMHLHLVDKNVRRAQEETENVILEEKRRAWWTLWEFDVFASSVRKLPPVIDWANNATWLPVDDYFWFNNLPARSCNLKPDPALAWKELEKSGNQSSRAWFIVVNALMRCAHTVAFPLVYPNSDAPRGEVSSSPEITQAMQANLDVLSNSLYCLTAALPPALSYTGEFLEFSTGNSLQIDSAKHSIHIMTSLCRFMLNHLRVFNSTYRRLGISGRSPSEQPENTAPMDPLSSVDKAAWTIYLAAASEIVNLIRNSSPKHVRLVNPFLSSTIWLAAAAQIISRKVAPEIVNRRVADSNLDVLQINLDVYVSFWGVSTTLQQKLKVLNAKLESIGRPLPSSDRAREQMPRSENSMVTPGALNAQPLNESAAKRQRLPNSYQNQYDFDNSSMNVTQTLNSDLWDMSQNFNFNGSMPDLAPENLWEYGLDELLAYSGFE